ncbi:MAG: hypothetical protein KDE26_18610 [Bacteroidetes bacterium]|nr:hypothetical protein [Bacteroidota bacterium]MCB0845272.1 hypothetical protein [Bacteroidota bacterium]
MKLRIFTILILSLSLSTLFAQKEKAKVKKSTGEYQINLSQSDYSEQEACKACQEQAMIQAIEKAFGSVVIQGNTTSIRNTNTGETVETSQVFNMIAETYVNGEWVKTLEEECERFTYNDEFWIKCKVKGQVQELRKPQIDLQVKALDCEEVTCETFEFRNEESFYLYLKSPIDGYVTIYLADASVSQRLLPFANMPQGQLNAVKVEADKEYILFSKEKDQLGLRGYIDEYEMYTEADYDQNRIFVIYSQEPLVKPALYEAGEDEKVEMPMQMDLVEFQKWLAKNRRYNEDMEVVRLDITIRK